METMQDARVEFGARVRKYRALRGWEMEDLAERLDRSTATISRIETGKQNVSVYDIRAIARVLGVRVSMLLDDDEALESSLPDKLRIAACADKGQKVLAMLEDVLKEIDQISN